MYRRTYADVFTGDEHWAALPVPEGDLFAWDPDSTYVRLPPYFDGMSAEPGTVEDVAGARCLVMVGDSVTTDHISPAGSIKPDSPAGRYLVEHGVERKDFNSYGSRRGNHEVMVRGTFANVRLRNLLVPGSEGTWTVHLPDGEEATIFEAAERYRAEGVPTIVLAGKEYGSGSSRDWAAKGPNLLGVRAVIAESYERIHRSNLIGMGIVPLQYPDGESAESLGLTGREVFAVEGLENGEASEARVTATPDDGGAGRLHCARAPRDAARARLPAPRRHPALRAQEDRRVLSGSSEADDVRRLSRERRVAASAASGEKGSIWTRPSRSVQVPTAIPPTVATARRTPPPGWTRRACSGGTANDRSFQPRRYGSNAGRRRGGGTAAGAESTGAAAMPARASRSGRPAQRARSSGTAGA